MKQNRSPITFINPLEPALFDSVEAGLYLKISRSMIYVLIADGSLTPIHFGRTMRISRAECDRLITKLEQRVF